MTEDDVKFVNRLIGMSLTKAGIMMMLKGNGGMTFTDLEKSDIPMKDVAELIVNGFIKVEGNLAIAHLPDVD